MSRGAEDQIGKNFMTVYTDQLPYTLPVRRLRLTFELTGVSFFHSFSIDVKFLTDSISATGEHTLNYIGNDSSVK